MEVNRCKFFILGSEFWIQEFYNNYKNNYFPTFNNIHVIIKETYVVFLLFLCAYVSSGGPENFETRLEWLACSSLLFEQSFLNPGRQGLNLAESLPAGPGAAPLWKSFSPVSPCFCGILPDHNHLQFISISWTKSLIKNNNIFIEAKAHLFNSDLSENRRRQGL